MAQALLSQHPDPAPVTNERVTGGKGVVWGEMQWSRGWCAAELGPPLSAEAVLRWRSAQLLYDRR